MKVLPSNALQILEFDTVLKLIASQCYTPMGKEQVLSMTPGSNDAEISQQLALNDEALNLSEHDIRFVDGAFPTIVRYLPNLGVDGYVLEADQMLEIRQFLSAVNFAASSLTGVEEELASSLKLLTAELPDLTVQMEAIDRILDEEGQVRPGASPELKRISRQLGIKRGEVDRVFQSMLRTYHDKGWLADSGESVRNGRRVLASRAENKRRIRGIIHDQSASGRTAFVEPEEVIELNNDIVDLHASRRAEEYRLLKDLCDQLRPYTEELELAEEILVQLDRHNACARFARSVNAVKPTIVAGAGFKLDHARHPILFNKNQVEGKKTIGFSLELGEKNRILLLSGPNAGGKSILMKSVGLLQVMVQSGLLVPCDPNSVFGIFEQVFVELGDRQSIEDDLSTYSSRLNDMRDFLEQANERTLLLIDEFGSGTDPKLGGAIAEALLHKLKQKEVLGVITTHYSELKAYAHKSRGIVNGAMIFDKESMRPTYQLRVGKPGSSFAFEIAKRSGLPEDVIDYARTKSGRNARAMEELIAELDAQKALLDKDQRQIERQRAQLEQLTRNYETMQTELTAQRKRMKLEQKERDYQHLSKLNKELERAVRQARESQNLERAKKELEKVKEARTTAREQLVQLNEDLSPVHTAPDRDLQPGDTVRIRGASDAGRVDSVDRKYANVIIGQLRMRVPIKDLEFAGEPIEVNPTRSVSTDISSQIGGSFNSMLDIRGMRARDALDVLQRFMDSALVSGSSYVEIVHGKGTGALRKLVLEKVTEYPISGTEHPEDAQGGSGTTIVRF